MSAQLLSSPARIANTRALLALALILFGATIMGAAHAAELDSHTGDGVCSICITAGGDDSNAVLAAKLSFAICNTASHAAATTQILASALLRSANSIRAPPITLV